MREQAGRRGEGSVCLFEGVLVNIQNLSMCEYEGAGSNLRKTSKLPNMIGREGRQIEPLYVKLICIVFI